MVKLMITCGSIMVTTEVKYNGAIETITLPIQCGKRMKVCDLRGDALTWNYQADAALGLDMVGVGSESMNKAILGCRKRQQHNEAMKR